MAKDIIQFSPHPKTPAAFVVTINGEPITPKDSTMLRRTLHQASMQERRRISESDLKLARRSWTHYRISSLASRISLAPARFRTSAFRSFE